MPQAIAGFLVKLGVSKLVAAIAAVAINVGITLGANALLNVVFGRGGAKPSDGQQNVNEGIGSRRRHYGIVNTGGQRSFLESANGRLGIVVTLGTGEESDILQHRINDRPVTVVGGTVTEPSYRGAIHIYPRSGSGSQTAISELTARFPEWTPDHRQRGCAHVAIICDPVKAEHFSEVFNGQLPVYTQTRKAAKVYDPRLDSTAVIYDDGAGFTVNGTGSQRLNDPGSWSWSDNAPLVVADYFAHPDGYGGGYGTVNWTNIAQEAEHADDGITTGTGEVIARWRLWASYSLASTERRRVMADLMKACDGFSWQDAQGRFNMMVGRFEESAIVITDDHILSMSPTIGPQAQQRVSAIKVLYTEAAAGYREQESATVIDPDAEDDPNTDPQALEAFYAPHHNQAVRVGQLALVRLGDRWHIPALLNLYGLNLIGERFCRVESAQLGVSGWFMVNGLRLLLGEKRVEANLDEIEPDDWELAPEDEGTPPLTPGGPAPVPALAAPTGLALSAVQIALGETNGVSIAASWDDPGRPDLSWEAKYRPSAGGDWVQMAVDIDARTARSGPVDSGIEYEVEVWAVTITGRKSATPATAAITPVAEAVALGAPTDLAAIGGTGEAEITLRLPTGAGLAYARLYRTATGSFTSPTQVGTDIVGALGEVVGVTDSALPSGTKYYWARAFDGASNPSALAGPVSATVS